MESSAGVRRAQIVEYEHFAPAASGTFADLREGDLRRVGHRLATRFLAAAATRMLYACASAGSPHSGAGLCVEEIHSFVEDLVDAYGDWIP
jgi:hypothetical protein